ncbi:MAG: PHP domain-containing protein [Oscillospiraceae bacterium]|nr:PHP domain-containing protein [Oscillospiraceae bacterium]
MYLYETHLHTAPVSACAAGSPAAQVRAYKAAGYAGIIVTDHFFNGNSGCPSDWPWDKKLEFFTSGYRQAEREGRLCGLDVFFGLEYCIRGTEFLTYGLSPEFLAAHPGMDTLTAAQYSALVRDGGGYLAQAHPYRKDWWIASPFPVDPGLIDGVEVYNASMPDAVNAKAREFARLHGLPAQAGSDSHSIGLPFMSGIGLARRAESIGEIIDALKAKRAKLIVPEGAECPPIL